MGESMSNGGFIDGIKCAWFGVLLKCMFFQSNMDIKAATCVYKLAGRCNRNLCRFLHRETPSPSNAYYNANTAYKYTRKPYSFDGNKLRSPIPLMRRQLSITQTVLVKRNEGAGDETSLAKAPQKPSLNICKYWVNVNCV